MGFVIREEYQFSEREFPEIVKIRYLCKTFSLKTYEVLQFTFRDSEEVASIARMKNLSKGTQKTRERGCVQRAYQILKDSKDYPPWRMNLEHRNQSPWGIWTEFMQTAFYLPQ